MENVRSYCDDILDVIHKFGEEYIYDPRTKIIDGKDLFVSVDNNINNDIAYSDDSDNRSNEACVNLGLTFAVGQHCEKLRVKYVDNLFLHKQSLTSNRMFIILTIYILKEK